MDAAGTHDGYKITVTLRHKRFALIGGGLISLGLAAALVLNAFQGNLVFFYTPTQVAQGDAPLDHTFRIGGLVKTGTIRREPDGLTVRFVVTDTARQIPVTYKGILPDLFREGKGVVAQGRLEAGGVFRASEVLAKHDENYMPVEAAEAIAKARASNAQRDKTPAGGSR